MKIKIAGIVCLLVLVGAWVYVRAQTATKDVLSTGANGRYQVVAVDFDETVWNGDLKHKSAIRIDTQTGKTWELMEVPAKPGGRALVWLPLGEQ